MKKLLTIVIALFSICGLAQAPNGFNYQASVRDANGDLVTEQSVSFKFHIIQGTQTTTPTYTETHSTNTDDLGQVSVVIGQGNSTSGSFSSIDWSLGSYFLKIEVELSAGSGYVDLGTTQFMSVPYALYAQNAGGSLPQGTSSGDTLKWNASSNSWEISSNSSSPIIISTDNSDNIQPDHINEKFILHNIGYNIGSDGGNTINSKGIVFGTSSDPSVENDTVVDAGPGIGSNNNLYINLDENTLYYYRAFATNSNGTYYGDTYVIETSTYIDIDQDNDGIIDDLDTCPNTIFGAETDNNGCSDSQSDSDNDGVNDDQDNCPGSNFGDQVDVNGCSNSQKDTDSDGVNDAIDYCPNSLPGDNVTDFGCTSEEQEQQGYIYLDSNGITVKANPWAITGQAYSLNGVEYTIVDDDNFMWWGNFHVCTTRVTSMENRFVTHRTFQQGIEINSWDTSNVTTMRRMFEGVSNFNKDISAWDTSNVTDMERAFANADSFNQDIGDWDISNVTNMDRMFENNDSFNQDLSSWDTSNVTNMNGMFHNSIFNNSLENWVIASNASHMFKNSAFDHPSASTWDISNVTDMSLMFYEATFNQDLSSWDTSNVTNMTKMFTGSQFNSSTENWVIAEIADGMFLKEWNKNSTAFNHPSASTWDTSNVTDMSRMFLNNDSFNQDISSWDTSNVIYMGSMFSDSIFNSSLENWVIASHAASMFMKSAFNHPSASTWDTSNVTDMNRMFQNSPFNQDIGDWNVFNVTNMQALFAYAKDFNQDISSWDVFNVTNMREMFYDADLFNQDLSKWNVKNVTDSVNFDRYAISWVLPRPIFN